MNENKRHRHTNSQINNMGNRIQDKGGGGTKSQAGKKVFVYLKIY